MKSTILVTGAAGFVGSHLVDHLLKQGHHVIAADLAPLEKSFNLQNAKKLPGFTYLQGDIRDINHLHQAFEFKPEKVFHMASIVGVNKYMEDPVGLIDIVVVGTKNIAELCLKNKAHLVFASTSEVFGKNPQVPWSEEGDRVLGHTGIDRWSYSSSKAVCEHLIRGLGKKKELPFTIVRYFNAYGPRQSPIFVVSKSVHRVLNNQEPLVYDQGVQTRCLTYIDDIVEGTLLAAQHPNGMREDFNLGNMHEVTMREVVESVIRQSGKDIKWKDFKTENEYGVVYEDIGRRAPSSLKAQEKLGWKIKTNHEEGIRKTIEWARDNSWWLA